MSNDPSIQAIATHPSHHEDLGEIQGVESILDVLKRARFSEMQGEMMKSTYDGHIRKGTRKSQSGHLPGDQNKQPQEKTPYQANHCR